MFDVMIIGGSYAGMAAALQLERGRRRVLVIDAGVRRNRFAETAHGLLGQDGKTPSEIADTAKAQLLNYPSITWVNGTAIAAEQTAGHFIVHTDTEKFSARLLILAVGIRDELPPVPGLQEGWGRSVFHCPYCHGYELDNGHLGVLATSEISMHQALLIPDWGKTTFFLNGIFEPNEDQLRQLAARQVFIERERVVKVSGPHATVALADGRSIPLAGLFVASHIHVASPLAQQLGCEFEDSPLGSIIKTNALKETSVPNVLACGDATRAASNIALAIADGTMAGAAAHRALIFDGLA